MNNYAQNWVRLGSLAQAGSRANAIRGHGCTGKASATTGRRSPRPVPQDRRSRCPGRRRPADRPRGGRAAYPAALSTRQRPTPQGTVPDGRTRLSSLCSFRTLYFTPESGPATEGFSCRGAVMNDEGNAARKIRKLRASRDLWKQRSAEKQQEIRQLRVTVRDLSSSRENWKTRVKELEQQLQAAHEAHAAVGPGSWIFFGGLMDNQAMPRTRRTPITLSSD